MKYNLSFSKWKYVLKRLGGKGIYPYEMAFLLNSPIRRFILSPEKLATRLHLSPGSVVLEIGSGPGYFSSEIAKRIPDGFLVLFDIQSEMLKKSRQKLSREKINNTQAIQGNAIALPFHSVFDVVFLVTVLGEIPKPKECLISIIDVLRAGGLLSITEMKGDPDVLTQDEIHLMAGQCGFEYLETYSSVKGFTMNFRKISSI